MSRARFLGAAAGVGAGVALPVGGGPAAAAQPGRAAAGGHHGLTYRGVVYEIEDGETPTTGWTPARARADLRAIACDLHANSVKVTGYGVERLSTTAAAAVEQGLHVWLEPTLGDVPEREILEHLAETGRFAERLRRQGAGVHLSVGCEFVLYVPGIVPGATILERVENLLKGNFDPVKKARNLRRFTARAAAVGRSVFHGPLTYASSEDETVDWDLFDIVGLDYYGYFRRRADYVRDLRRHLRPGKPLAIMEYGCCTFKGAPKAGGMGWNIVDYTKKPEEIKKGYVRSERTQAAYLTDVLGAFESMNLYAALAFTFVTADAPHRPRDPRHDLDMASYGLVKPIEDGRGRWHWEPKEAFHALRACLSDHAGDA